MEEENNFPYPALACIHLMKTTDVWLLQKSQKSLGTMQSEGQSISPLAGP